MSRLILKVLLPVIMVLQSFPHITDPSFYTEKYPAQGPNLKLELDSDRKS